MLTEKERKALTLIDANKEETVEYLRKLIGFKTVTPAGGKKAEGDDCRRLQDLIYKTLGEMNFELDRWEKVIQALEELTDEWRNRADKQHKLLKPDMIIPTVVRGGDWPVTYPEEVDIVFGADCIPRTSAANLRQEIQEKITSVTNADPWMKEHPPKLETHWWHGIEIDENEPIVKTGIEAVHELGIESKPAGMGSVTDAVALVRHLKIPTISIGPDDRTAHASDEYVDINQLVTVTKALALAIMRWCG